MCNTHKHTYSYIFAYIKSTYSNFPKQRHHQEKKITVGLWLSDFLFGKHK